MKEKKAWEALFAPTPPSGVDFEEAASAVEGQGQVDMSITLDPPVQRCVDEFQMDPAGFLVANKNDERLSQWTRLATALVVSVTGDSSIVTAQPVALPTVATPLSGQPLLSGTGTAPTVASTAPASVTKKTLSASELMNASVGAGTPDVPVFGSGRAGGTSTDIAIDPDVVDDRPGREKKKRRGRDRNEGEEEGDRDGDRDDRPRERLKRRPPPSSVSSVVRPRIVAILGTESFQEHRARILTLFQSIREGDSDAQDELVQLERELRAIVRAMPTGYLVMASAELALDMIQSLRADKDQSESDWFQANYVTGSYG